MWVGRAKPNCTVRRSPWIQIVFAIEELARSFEERASGVMLTAVVLAGVIVLRVRHNPSIAARLCCRSYQCARERKGHGFK
jgi:hypothetical protein